MDSFKFAIHAYPIEGQARSAMRETLRRQTTRVISSVKHPTAQTVELRLAPTWQLVFPERAAGELVRTMT